MINRIRSCLVTVTWSLVSIDGKPQVSCCNGKNSSSSPVHPMKACRRSRGSMKEKSNLLVYRLSQLRTQTYLCSIQPVSNKIQSADYVDMRWLLQSPNKHCVLRRCINQRYIRNRFAYCIGFCSTEIYLLLL